MTFGHSSFGRSISSTRLFLKRQMWIWPIIAVVVLAFVGYGISSAIKLTMDASLQSELQTLLNVEVSMIEKWLAIQEGNAQSLANSQIVRATTEQLIANNAAKEIDEGMQLSTADLAKIRAKLEQELSPAMSSQNFVGYTLLDKEQLILASSHIELIGQTVPQYESFISRALEGSPTVSTPFASIVASKDSSGKLRTGVPTMFALAPVRDQNFQVIAVLAMRIRPEREFTQILQLGRMGKSGETYAFNKMGVMVSNSRFDDDLILLGLLPDQENVQSILAVSLRDPGGDMTRGFRPGVRRSELPLTQTAAAAIAGNSGVNIKGSRDYRGVQVVSAWAWLPKYEMGLATEIEFAEAFRPLTILRYAFFSLFGLLIFSSIAIFVFTLSVARLQREAQKAAHEAKQLGQYQLEARIGSGAMGVVYRGCHAMLRRPTAIKLLSAENVTENAIQRFEHEVQITCKLNHPSTISIYDYGRTPEGVFYYAMEYLDGVNLQVLVDKYGPQPEGRVIHILRQVCGSLYEAHSLGLVHRDIKPANIMVNRRGGEADVVKVLDFGLVKKVDSQQQEKTEGLSGTPLYMSPESIQTPDLVDVRSDLYAVGAVAYYLLTGKPVFQADTLMELCQMHIAAIPDLPSQRLGKPVSPELEAAIMSCLEKSRVRRPQTARDLLALLNRASTANSWTQEDAEAWWGSHERGQVLAATAADQRDIGNHTTGTAFDRTLAHETGES